MVYGLTCSNVSEGIVSALETGGIDEDAVCLVERRPFVSVFTREATYVRRLLHSAECIHSGNEAYDVGSIIRCTDDASIEVHIMADE